MSTTSGRGRRFAAAAGLVLAGAMGATMLTGMAYAQESTDGAPVSQEGDGWLQGPRIPGLGPVLHGQAVVRDRDGGFRTVLTQNGTIDAVSASSITVTSEDGYSKSYSIGQDTSVRVDRDKSEVADLAAGRPARVVATTDGAAIRIGSSTEAGAAEAQSQQQERGKWRDAIRDFLRERFGQGQSEDSAGS